MVAKRQEKTIERNVIIGRKLHSSIPLQPTRRKDDPDVSVYISFVIIIVRFITFYLTVV